VSSGELSPGLISGDADVQSSTTGRGEALPARVGRIVNPSLTEGGEQENESGLPSMAKVDDDSVLHLGRIEELHNYMVERESKIFILHGRLATSVFRIVVAFLLGSLAALTVLAILGKQGDTVMSFVQLTVGPVFALATAAAGYYFGKAASSGK